MKNYPQLKSRVVRKHAFDKKTSHFFIFEGCSLINSRRFLLSKKDSVWHISTKEGILPCTSLIRIMKPLGSMGPPQEIKTPQVKCRNKSHSQKSSVFLHNLYWWTSQEGHKKSSLTLQIAEFPECQGPDQLLTQDSITAMPTVKWMPPSCRKETGFYFVSLPTQTAFTTVRAQNSLSKKDF